MSDTAREKAIFLKLMEEHSLTSEKFLESIEEHNLTSEILPLSNRKRAEIFIQLSDAKNLIGDAKFKNKKIKQKISKCRELKKLHHLYNKHIRNLTGWEFGLDESTSKLVEELIKVKIEECEKSSKKIALNPIKRICLENVSLILKESNIRKYKLLANQILDAVNIKISDKHLIKEKNLPFMQLGNTKLSLEIGLNQKIPSTFNMIAYPQTIPTNLKKFYFRVIELY